MPIDKDGDSPDNDARHGSETSGAIGIDNAYIFDSKFAIAEFYEDARGDFDIQATGMSFGKFFDNGWKASTEPGIERKLKDNKKRTG